MSRSYKRVPVVGFSCHESEKKDKRKANRRFRRISRYLTSMQSEIIPIRMCEVSTVWDFAKDGKINLLYHPYKCTHDWILKAYRK